MGEAGKSMRCIGEELWDLKGGRSPKGQWGVIARSDHAFLGEEAVQRITEGGEQCRVQGPVAELRLAHALQQVWQQEIRKMSARSASKRCELPPIIHSGW